MKTKILSESSKCQAAADDLLLQVSQIMEKAEFTIDADERFALYKEAMEKNNKAYVLIAKARELRENGH